MAGIVEAKSALTGPGRAFIFGGRLMELVDLFSITSRLSSLTRFSMERPTERESVLEHVGFVAIVVLALSDQINRIQPRIHGAPPIVSRELALVKAVIHDIEEIVTGDIPRPTKKAFEAQDGATWDGFVCEAIYRVAKRFENSLPGVARTVGELHGEAKDGPEGLVVAIADVLAVVYMVWREVIVRGNTAMVRQAYTADAQVEALWRRVDAEFPHEAALWLSRILKQARMMMATAIESDDPIYGTMREDV
jgi:5'-deoxynucleotidase YfbR-like HD superfamily hydrolase